MGWPCMAFVVVGIFCPSLALASALPVAEGCHGFGFTFGPSGQEEGVAKLEIMEIVVKKRQICRELYRAELVSWCREAGY